MRECEAGICCDDAANRCGGQPGHVILIDSDESDSRLALLHENVRKNGTVLNTVARGTTLEGILSRAP